MQFSFDLFGFDLLHKDSIYGLWVMAIKDWEDKSRSLFCAHYAEGEWRLELLWLRVI